MKHKWGRVDKRAADRFFHDAKLDAFCGSNDSIMTVLRDDHIHVLTFDSSIQIMLNNNDKIEVALFGVETSHYRRTVEINADKIVT